jgi:hypothetical protein
MNDIKWYLKGLAGKAKLTAIIIGGLIVIDKVDSLIHHKEPHFEFHIGKSEE